jgi:hypothetical protein
MESIVMFLLLLGFDDCGGVDVEVVEAFLSG